ncbi:hypothetical protein [Bacillus sp. AK128]
MKTNKTAQEKHDKPKNSSMVNSEEELEKHSKIMEQMATNQEVKDDNKIPDPKQFTDKERSKK